MAEQLIKRWTNWEDGIGYDVDDGQHNGFLGPDQGGTEVASFVGTKTALIVPPGVTTLSNATAVSFHHFRFGWVEYSPLGVAYLYLLSNNDTTGSAAAIYKVDWPTAAALTSILYDTELIGRPEKYEGLWYFCNLEAGGEIRELTTIDETGAITSDTIGLSTGDRGQGHLFLSGHQLASLGVYDLGVRLLATGDNPVSGTWGSYFPVGDQGDFPIGGGSLSGLNFVLRNRGLYSFNDRGRSGTISEDFAPWQAASFFQGEEGIWLSAPWKGGLVFAHPSGIYYFSLQTGLPIDISVGRRLRTSGHKTLFPHSTLAYLGITAVGDCIYTWASGNGTGVQLFCGQSIGGDPTNISWSAVAAQGVDLDSSMLLPIMDAGIHGTYTGGGGNLLFCTSSATRTLSTIGIGHTGAPLINGAITLPATVKGLMSELEFPSPIRLTRAVINLRHMTAGAPIQLYGYIDNGTTAENFGAPVVADDRHEITINRDNVHRLILGISYDGSALGSAAQPPEIGMIELYGEPT